MILRKYFLVCLLFVSLPLAAQAQSGNWQQPKPMQQSGEIQQPKGKWQQPKEKWQEGGEIQVPRGIQAVTEKEGKSEKRLVICADALFDYDSATLSDKAEETLHVVGPKLAELGQHPVRLEGHTDSDGDHAYNQTLSVRRAEAVKKWLIANNYLKGTAKVRGFGETRPAAANAHPDGSDNPKGRQKNRRVEIIVEVH